MARSKDRRPVTAAETMSIDEYLTHTSSAGGSGSYLKNWKDDGFIVVWLHPKAPFAAPWFFRFYRLVKDREGDGMRVRSWRVKSMDRDAVMRKQHFREDDGTREYPPEVCAFAKTLEWVHQAVEEGTLADTDVIFRWEGDDDEDEPIELHAGGFTGQIAKRFRDKEVTKEDKRRYREAGIRGDEVWRESCAAKLNYVFGVVPHDEAEDGPVIAIEGKTLGDQMKKVIRDRREDLDTDEGNFGNPIEYPVAFKWIYDDDESFSRKYDVKVRTSVELTDQVRAAFDMDPPDFGPVLEPYNVAELRLAMEEAWCCEGVTPPWDELFAAAEESVKGTPLAELPSDFNPENYEDEEEDGDEPEKSTGPEETEAEDEDGEELYECDACGQPMPDAPKCPHCGAEYDEAGELIKKPEKQATRKRSSAKKDKAETAAPAKEARAPRRRGGKS